MLDNINSQDKPNYGGYFIGTVVENDDPKFIERIKVTIPNLFEGEAGTLPWLAKKKVELFADDSGGSFGTFGLVPAVGTQVIVSFQDSNPLYGMYEGTPHQTDERVSEALTNYLFRYGFKDPAGNLFMVDTTEGAVEILVQHKSGTLFKIMDNGDIELTCVGTITSSAEQWNHTGNIHVTGDIDVIGDIDVTGGIVTTGDVVAAGISLDNHVHGGVIPGTANTAVPQ